MNTLLQPFDLYDAIADPALVFSGGIEEFIKTFDKSRAFSYFKTDEQTDVGILNVLSPGTHQIAARAVSPVFASKKLTAAAITQFISEQEFEGVVISVFPDYFLCRLIDLTMNEPDEEAEIEFSEVSPDDRHLISPGALFSWNIGRVERKRQITRMSEIRFRRTFTWGKAALEKSIKEAEELQQTLGWGHVVNDAT